jgi:hypothetical protein
MPRIKARLWPDAEDKDKAMAWCRGHRQGYDPMQRIKTRLWPDAEDKDKAMA